MDVNPVEAIQTGAQVTAGAAGWGEMDNSQRARTVAGAAKTGAAATGQNIPGINAVTAIMTVDKIYSDWGKMKNEQRAVAAASLASSAAAAAGYSIPGLNVALAGYNAYQYTKAGYQQYYQGGTSKQKAGYVAGSALVGPVNLGIMSTASSMFKSGKGKDQVARDFLRKDLKTKGIYNKDFSLDLADGTKANVGLDGGATHAVRYKDKLVDSKSKGEIGAYNTDYTNDLDFFSGMTGNTFARLMYGGRDPTIDQTGGQLGNAFLGKVGYGQDMTAENFNTVMTNARGVYAKAGIKSKEDGLELVNRAVKEGRLSNADAIAAQQSLGMMYDKDGFEAANKLSQGRWVGVDKLADAPERTPTVSIGYNSPGPVSTKTAEVLTSKEEIRARNLAKYASVGV